MTAVFFANLPAFKNGLNVTRDKLEAAVSMGLMQAAVLVETEAKKNANTGNHKKGEPRVSGGGAGPNVVTGNLRNNIAAQPVRKGFGTYIASVTSSAEYARAVEEGSSRWKSGVSYPYLNPAFKTLIENGTINRTLQNAVSRAIRG